MTATADPWPCTRRLGEVFSQEITALNGTVSDTFDDGSRLFMRSVLPRFEDLRPGDQVRGGVALRATGEDVWIHPYVLRTICTNGAIIAHAIQTRHIERASYSPAEKTEAEAIMAVREAVRSCSGGQAFSSSAEEMRSARMAEIDLMLTMSMLSSRIPESRRSALIPEIMNHFRDEGDRSRFGLMNAVTATARDTPDPETRWQLETLGGSIPKARLVLSCPEASMTELIAEFQAA